MNKIILGAISVDDSRHRGGLGQEQNATGSFQQVGELNKRVNIDLSEKLYSYRSYIK